MCGQRKMGALSRDCSVCLSLAHPTSQLKRCRNATSIANTGHCSELCGLNHAKMLFTLKVVTPQQFQAYMAAQQAAQSSSGSTQ